MPAVAVAVAATAASSVIAAAGLSIGAAIAAQVGVALVSGLLTRALTPKPKGPSFSQVETGQTRQFRQPITNREIVYGEVRKSGPIVFIGTTEDNKFLHMVVALASHEVEGIGEIIVNDKSITDDMLDGSGNVTDGFYANKMRIQKALGSTTQTANADLVSEVAEWTTDHRLQGIAYLYVRLQRDRDVYASGIPNISAWIKGKKILDTRDSTTKWTNNIALQARDYLVDDLGLGALDSSIDSSIDSTANTCEEFIETTGIQFTTTDTDNTTDIITISGNYLELLTGDKVSVSGGSIPAPLTEGAEYYVIIYQRKETPRIKLATSYANALAGTAIDITGTTSGFTITKDAEPRYRGGGTLQTSAEHHNNMQEILSGMGGQAAYVGGSWLIQAAEYRIPTIAFDENDLVGPIEVQTKQSERDRFNRIQGTYVAQINQGNPSDYPVVKNALYESEDGKVILKGGVELPFTQSPITAQRIAKIQLERSRQEIIFEASFRLQGFNIQVGDNFLFTFERYGWDQKVFEVLSWELAYETEGDMPLPVIRITARENASGVYDWNAGEETTVDLAPNTNLPNPFSVPSVVGFSLDSVLVDTQGGDKTFQVLASWDISTNQFVVEGGFYEIEFKKTTETIYKSAAKVDGSINEQEINELQPDIGYDIRIRAINSLYAVSPYVLIEGFVVGSTVTTDTEDWENETLARSGDDWEVDTLTSEDWES